MKGDYDSREFRRVEAVRLDEVNAVARVSVEDASQLYFQYREQRNRGETKY